VWYCGLDAGILLTSVGLLSETVQGPLGLLETNQIALSHK
jgi:hypothetical protein